MSISKQPAAKRSPKKVTPRTAPAPKVFDVARPGKTPANSTSKPVIITNRPVMQDPMVVTVNDAPTPEASKDEPTTAPILKPTKKLVIKPLHDHIEPEPAATTESAPLADTTEETLAVSNEAEPATLDAIGAQAAAAAQAAAEPEPQPEPDEPLKPELETIAFSHTTPGIPTQNPVVADDQIKPPAVPQPAIVDEVAVPVKADSQLTPAAEEAAALAAQKREVELRRIIDREQYFLPINSVENKRNKRIAILGLVLIVILGAAWYDTALDAGLLPNTYNVPHSHFFIGHK